MATPIPFEISIGMQRAEIEDGLSTCSDLRLTHCGESLPRCRPFQSTRFTCSGPLLQQGHLTDVSNFPDQVDDDPLFLS